MTTTAPNARPPTLPDTGAGNTTWLAIAGLLTSAAGIVILTGQRRRLTAPR
ncbi:MAG: LPXTG cell wall anchor domain-containing protein [Acidimicrobiales bacterium]